MESLLKARQIGRAAGNHRVRPATSKKRWRTRSVEESVGDFHKFAASNLASTQATAHWWEGKAQFLGVTDRPGRGAFEGGPTRLCSTCLQ